MKRGENEKQELSDLKARFERQADQLPDFDDDLNIDLSSITDERQRAAMYDKIRAKIGEIMITACKTADEIIANANARAEKILRDAQQQACSSQKKGATPSGSSSVPAAEKQASDFGSYIKNAVDGCL